MYKSVLKIYDYKANEVTDSYQKELCEEWIAEFANDYKNAVRFLPRMMTTIGWRVFRLELMKAVCKKCFYFIKKK